MFLRNVGTFSNYTELYHIRPFCSELSHGDEINILGLLNSTFKNVCYFAIFSWDNSYKRCSLYSLRTEPRKTRPLLLCSADRTENIIHVIPTQLVHWRTDCCLATSYKHSSYCCVFTISLSSNGNTLRIVGQEFVFAGTCLTSCSLETDIHVTIYIYIYRYLPNTWHELIAYILHGVECEILRI
jgi:hypothetical protein